MTKVKQERKETHQTSGNKSVHMSISNLVKARMRCRKFSWLIHFITGICYGLQREGKY